jgi:hypothetical protein
MSQSSWLVAALVPGLGRHPLKKINPDEIAERRTQLIEQQLQRLQFEFDTTRDSYHSIVARRTLRGEALAASGLWRNTPAAGSDVFNEGRWP